MENLNSDPFGLLEDEFLDKETGEIFTKKPKKKKINPTKCKHKDTDPFDIPHIKYHRFRGRVCNDCNTIVSWEKYKPEGKF